MVVRSLHTGPELVATTEPASSEHAPSEYSETTDEQVLPSGEPHVQGEHERVSVTLSQKTYRFEYGFGHPDARSYWLMQYVHPSAPPSLPGGAAGRQVVPGSGHWPYAIPQHPCTKVGGTSEFVKIGGPAAMQSLSLKTRGATVTDWTLLVIASSVVQLPSQALGGSNPVPVPPLVQVEAFAVAAPGREHDPVGAAHKHDPHGRSAGALSWM
jgi:hypothetical protein